MNLLSFYLSDIEDISNLLPGNISFLIFIGLFLIISLLADKGLSIFEKAWGTLSDRIYNPTEDGDPFGEYTSPLRMRAAVQLPVPSSGSFLPPVKQNSSSCAANSSSCAANSGGEATYVML